MLEHIERLQSELEAMRDYHAGYLNRRARTVITTTTDTVMAQHQEMLAEVLDLLEVIKAEKRSETEAEQQQ